MGMNVHSAHFLECVVRIADELDYELVDKMADELAALRARNGRLFILGVGGSAANASHAVNDFRKLCNIEAYAPTDNVAELTARVNDSEDGWERFFIEWLKCSQVTKNDALLVLSVGGGSYSVSRNIALAVDCGAKVLGIVGRDGGTTAAHGGCVIIIPTVDENLVTPLTESFQSILLHALVSHPKLQANKTKW